MCGRNESKFSIKLCAKSAVRLFIVDPSLLFAWSLIFPTFRSRIGTVEKERGALEMIISLLPSDVHLVVADLVLLDWLALVS